MKKKLVIGVTAFALLLCFAIGGTLAWLVAKSNTVVNTFTYGDINISLSESENLNLKMVPGNTITKDPKVTVKANSEACWLFVEIEKSSNFDTFMTYEIADGWTQLTGSTELVYYRQVSAKDAAQEFNVIKNNTVTVKDGVTKAMLNAFDTNKDGTLSAEEQKSLPTLTFTAYAVQMEGFNDSQKTEADNAALAWAEAKK